MFILVAKAVNAVTNSEVLTLSLVGIVSGALLVRLVAVRADRRLCMPRALSRRP